MWLLLHCNNTYYKNDSCNCNLFIMGLQLEIANFLLNVSQSFKTPRVFFVYAFAISFSLNVLYYLLFKNILCD